LCDLEGRNRASLDIQLEPVSEQAWRCTWRPLLCKLGFRNRLTLAIHFGGRNSARLDEYSVEAVDGRFAGCADFIHELVNSQTWEYDNVTLPLSSHGELADGSRSFREARQKLKLHSGVNS
jgi:hypothetical protein